MTATQINANSYFPFVVGCRLTKTFFGVPRKCSECQKMIVLTAGYACQFCRFRCHKRCVSEGMRSCSLSQLSKEGKNDMMEKRDQLADALPANDWLPSPSIDENSSREDETTNGETSNAFDRLLQRLFSTCKRGQSGDRHSPVDQWNDTVIDQLTSATDLLSLTGRLQKQMQWARYITGNRSAHSQDCALNRSIDEQNEIAFKVREVSDSRVSTNHDDELKRSNSWPVLGLHINYDEDWTNGNSDSTLLLPVDPVAIAATTTSKLDDGDIVGEWAIPWEDVTFGKCVLEGSQMRMYRGRWHGEVMLHEYLQEERFLADVHSLSKMRHENIALFMGASVRLPRMLVVTSIRKGDSLYDSIHIKRLPLSYQSKVNIAKQIAQGMGYLHAKGIVLQCLTSRNVYLECKVKICALDYGSVTTTESPNQLAYISPELMKTVCFQPPDVHIGGMRTRQTDIYAYGTILFEMVANRFPFWQEPLAVIIYRVGKGDREQLDTLDCHLAMKCLIDNCWSSDPLYRPSFPSILKKLHHTVALHKKHSSSVPERLNRIGQKQRHRVYQAAPV